jgi:hypothetical protein
MRRILLFLACLLASSFLRAADEKLVANPSFGYDVARSHELKPHRRTIPIKGVQPGFNQLHLTITVSATGEVMEIHPSVEVDPPSYEGALKFWPQLEGEVRLEIHSV